MSWLARVDHLPGGDLQRREQRGGPVGPIQGLAVQTARTGSWTPVTPTTPSAGPLPGKADEHLLRQRPGRRPGHRDRRQSWTLDPNLRLRATTIETANGAGGWDAVTRVNHYAGEGDSPRWINEGDGTTSRYAVTLDGTLLSSRGNTAAMSLINLHGDVSVELDITGPVGSALVHGSDEFGVPSTGQPGRYGWLGGEQRSQESVAGATLMGVRLYQPTLGRFLQADPVYGGNSNAYEYTNGDPVNFSDTTGRAHEPRGCAMIDYFKRVCAPPYGLYVGSVRTPYGWNFIGLRYGHCTRSPDRPDGFNFLPACQVHDYGYELIRRRKIFSKGQVDSYFHTLLRHGTCPAYSGYMYVQVNGWVTLKVARRSRCNYWADRYYRGVQILGSP